MIRNLFLICVALLLTALSIYTLGSRKPRADFTYVNPSGIHTLDPSRMSWTQDFRVALNIWEGLTTWHPETLEPIEGAALFPPDISSDGLTYVFTIRDDTRWSNGDRVTSRDFLRGWRRGLEPGTATDYTFLLADNIAGADEYVRWRREAVGELVAMKRLCDGWSINARQARTIAQSRVFKELQARVGDTLRAPEAEAEEWRWESWIQGIAPRVDWENLYDRMFQKHVSELRSRFDDVGIVTRDDQTLVVRLAQPCPYFLDLIALPIFLPCHESIELLRERYRGTLITAEGLVVYDPQWTKPDYHRNNYPGLVTNGPYRLSDWTFKRRARLTVNPHHRTAKTITCRTVDMMVYDNISASIMAYEAGDVDFLPAMDVPYDHEIARLAQTGERKDFHLCHVLATYFLNFNCVSESVDGRPNPFVDPRIRRAFALAIDRERIVEKVLKRGDRVARSFVPPDTISGYQPPTGLVMDVDRARGLLAEAGYPEGVGLPAIELLYTPSDERVCQAMGRMWEDALGVRVELRSKESKTFAEDKASHRYMIARGNWYADYNDPMTFLDCLSTGNGNNDSGYVNPRYDAMLAEASVIRDPVKRAALLRQAEAIIVEEDLPILPILHYAAPIAIKPYVSDLYANSRLWFPFRYVTVER